MTLTNDFANRLINSGDDTSWRAGKTIQELEAKIDEKDRILRKYYYMLQGFREVIGPVSFDDHDSNIQLMEGLATNLKGAIKAGTVQYSVSRGFLEKDIKT